MARWDFTANLDQDAGAYEPVHSGGYDLSGALLNYAAVPGLVDAARAVGLRNWRVGLGRWEIGTEMFPSVPQVGGPTTCTAPLFPIQASLHATLEDLLAERDFFALTVDHGTPGAVDLQDLEDPANYHFAYLDRVLAQAAAFGFEPFLNVDHMPRVLARNQTLHVAHCDNTFRNGVSTSPPLNNNAYAYVVVRAVDHVLSGWPTFTTPTYPLRDLEIGNEPDAEDNFWSGTAQEFQEMYVAVAGALRQARDDAPQGSPWKDLRVGGGSFAFPPARAGVTSWVPAFLDAVRGTPGVPLDFLSVHSYSNDGSQIVVDELNTFLELAHVRHAGRFAQTQRVLAEWGPDLAYLVDRPFNRSMQAPLVYAFGLLGAHALRFSMTHKSLFYDYVWDSAAGFGLLTGLVDAQVQVSPAGRVYTLMSQFMATPRILEAPAVYPGTGPMDGLVVAGQTQDHARVQLVVTNRAATARLLRITLSGAAAFAPTTLRETVLDGDGSALRSAERPAVRQPYVEQTVPPQSVVLLTLE